MKINGTAISFDVKNANGRLYDEKSINIETLEEIEKTGDILDDNNAKNIN